MSSQDERTADFAIVGGGIVGLATALALIERGSVLVLEAEDRVARHQTGHNSGVIHSGLYYKPGSLKAQLCTAGRQALYQLCAEENLVYRRCGKLVVATHEPELPALDELERRGRGNGLTSIERLDSPGIRAHEPHVSGIAALWVPETGIVDYVAVCQALVRRLERAGGKVRTSTRVQAVRTGSDAVQLETAAGRVSAAQLVNCAGLQSDRIARLCGADPGVRIVPFRGEYYEVKAERRHLVRGPVYPVPDPRFPFLDVHFTPTVDGRLEAGPNAVLALRREGYTRRDFSLRDTLSTLTYPGFWHLARRFWRTGIAEELRSRSPRRFVAAMQRLVPEIQLEDVVRAGSGVRAQAVSPQGQLLDDFHIVTTARAVHVLNAPSPAATAALAIGRYIAAQIA